MAIRAFIAVDIPENVIPQITQIIKEIKDTKMNLKLVEPENIHFTLKFLGEIPEEEVAKLAERIEKFTFDSFSIVLTKIGVFPDIAYPKVIWLGMDDEVKMKKLHQDLLKHLELKYEKGEFVPHLTIARVKSGENREKLIPLLSRKLSIAIPVTTISLKKSVLTPKGPIYTNIAMCSARR
ncbi:MAG: RNA 2',3'-cyclic phosphodiesterase [Candidatus Korarchaeota archaeon]